MGKKRKDKEKDLEQLENKLLGKEMPFALDIKLMAFSQYNSVYLKVENVYLRISDHKWTYEENKRMPDMEVLLDNKQLIKLKNVLGETYKAKMKKQNLIKYKGQKIFKEK